MSNEKNHVIIKNGERASGLLSEEQAKEQADAMRAQINEKSGQAVKEAKIEVKQNLFGAIAALLVPIVCTMCSFTSTNL